MRSLKDLQFYGGLPCLDFVNSVDWRGREEPEEYLCSYAGLLEWSVLTGVLKPAQARALQRETSQKAATAALERALVFREAAYRVLLAGIRGKAPDASDLRAVNAVLTEARAHATLQRTGFTFAWTLDDANEDPNLPLWSVALSLADLLTSEELRHVRLCGGPECGWLFLDTSKSGKRRWCSMEGCGNRAKARRHYARTR